MPPAAGASSRPVVGASTMICSQNSLSPSSGCRAGLSIAKVNVSASAWALGSCAKHVRRNGQDTGPHCGNMRA
jgi:hypothetical protein